MFAGLTSAYIVKGSQPEGNPVEIPGVFSYFHSCDAVQQCHSSNGPESTFKERKMQQYRRMITLMAVGGNSVCGVCNCWDFISSGKNRYYS